MACAQRETWEETGIKVTCDRIAYIREFRNTEQSIRHIEFFLIGQNPQGEVTLDHIPDLMSGGKYVVVEAQWLTRNEMKSITVFPEILQHEEFWQDVAQGFPQVKYLEPKIY
jgi:8-oxo-dGTP pyrophosphatase MutT (NUDIX family)